MAGTVVVFDLDGTLTDSVPTYTRACGEAWRQLAAEGVALPDGPPTAAAVAGLMGRPTAAIWAGLMPGAPEAVRRRGAELARASFHAELEDRGPVLFPGAAAAVGELAREGHGLHVLSNGSEAYIELVLRRSGLVGLSRSASSALGTGKVAAAGRLAAASPGRPLVMAGDRAEDVQAGRAHGFALGCAYGYGAEGELEGAHYLVRRSEDLAAGVRRLLLLARLRAAIPETAGRPVLVGITGPDCAGKSALAEELARFLAAEGQRACLVPVDDFHRPAAARQGRGEPPPYCYYHYTFDWAALVQDVLLPARGGGLSARRRPIDLRTDASGEDRLYLAGPGDVVLVEGVFLFRPELEGLFDLTVYVEATAETILARAEARDGHLFGEPGAVRARYLAKYLPGQALSAAECRPKERADFVVDNDDWRRPGIRPRRAQ